MRFTAALATFALLSQASAFGVNGPQKAQRGMEKTALNVDASVLQTTDPTILGAAGAAIAGIFGFVAKSAGDSAGTATANPIVEEEPEPIDVSIPYDAAARLAFASKSLPEAKFAEFQSLYEEATVADVTVKKFARDLKDMEAAAAKKGAALESFQ